MRSGNICERKFEFHISHPMRIPLYRPWTIGFQFQLMAGSGRANEL